MNLEIKGRLTKQELAKLDELTEEILKTVGTGKALTGDTYKIGTDNYIITIFKHSKENDGK